MQISWSAMPTLNIGNLGDLTELRGRHAVFAAVVENGPLGDT
jgi:hypothetical protein